MGTPVELKSPLLGVVKNPNFQDFPQGAAIDALNVLPYDRTGRNRVNQRAGTDKAFAGQMGNGSQFVQGIFQTTLALDPSTIVPGTTLLNETFQYANGSLATVSGGVWTNVTGLVNTHVIGGSTVPVVSNQVVLGVSATGSSARLTTAPALGSAYIVQLAGQFGTLSTGGTNDNLSIAFQVATASPTNTGWILSMGLATGTPTTVNLFLFKGGSSSAVATFTQAGFITLGTTYTLELHVNGSVVAGYINGVKYLQFIIDATYAANTDVGFSLGTSSSSAAHSTLVSQFKILTGVSASSFRQTNIVTVTGGNVYIGSIAGGTGTNVLATAGTNVLATGVLIGGAYSAGIVYLVDGFSVQTLNLTTQVVAAFVATAGSTPANCQLACIWRDRLVLAAPRGTPQNFFMSRVGTQTDFDFSQVDSAAAFAGNASTAGHIGEPITALIPFSDDVLFIGGDHNMWAVRGDPADGGSIDLVSDSIGVLGQNAWVKAPDSTLYFAGTGGLYMISPGTALPVNISNQQWNEFFRAINRGSSFVTLSYDRDQQGMYIFVTPAAQGASTHLWWDARSRTFWPFQLPNVQGPLASIVYDGDGPTDRTTLLGGYDGYMRRFALTDTDDDGTAITSYVYLGPFHQQDTNDNLLEWLDVVLGDLPAGFSTFNVQVDIQSAGTVEAAYNAPVYTRTKVYSVAGSRNRWLMRQRGSAFFMKLSNSTQGATWAFEKITALFTPAGTVRNRR